MRFIFNYKNLLYFILGSNIVDGSIVKIDNLFDLLMVSIVWTFSRFLVIIILPILILINIEIKNERKHTR